MHMKLIKLFVMSVCHRSFEACKFQAELATGKSFSAGAGNSTQKS